MIYLKIIWALIFGFPKFPQKTYDSLKVSFEIYGITFIFTKVVDHPKTGQILIFVEAEDKINGTAKMWTSFSSLLTHEQNWDNLRDYIQTEWSTANSHGIVDPLA